jgi:hypothetical protein
MGVRRMKHRGEDSSTVCWEEVGVERFSSCSPPGDDDL